MNEIAQIVRTGSGKAVIVLWGLALLTLVALPTLGLFHREFLGNLGFGILVSSALLNISVIVSYRVSRASLHLAKAAWVGIGVFILAFTLYLYDGTENSDVCVFLGWAMLVQSFPASLVVNLVFAGISYLLVDVLPGAVKVSYAYLFAVWIGFFVAGYLQWFRLIPALLAKFGKTKESP